MNALLLKNYVKFLKEVYKHRESMKETFTKLSIFTSSSFLLGKRKTLRFCLVDWKQVRGDFTKA